ncbi:hypothetical protein M153_1992000340, partial [Pseudoloma neurophilia]
MKFSDFIKNQAKNEFTAQKLESSDHKYEFLTILPIKDFPLIDDQAKSKYAKINTDNYFKQHRMLFITPQYGYLYLLLSQIRKNQKKSYNGVKRLKQKKMTKDFRIKEIVRVLDPFTISGIMQNVNLKYNQQHRFFLPLTTSIGFKKILKNKLTPENISDILFCLQNNVESKKIWKILLKSKNFTTILLQCTNLKIIRKAIDEHCISLKNDQPVLSDKSSGDNLTTIEHLRSRLLNDTNLYAISKESHSFYIENIKFVGLQQLFALFEHLNTSDQIKCIQSLTDDHVIALNSVEKNQIVQNATKKSLMKLSLQNIETIDLELKIYKSFDRISVARTIIEESFDHMLDLYANFLEKQDPLFIFIFECQLFDYIKDCHRSYFETKTQSNQSSGFLMLGSINIGGTTSKAARKIKKAVKFFNILRKIKSAMKNDKNYEQEFENIDKENKQTCKMTMAESITLKYLHNCFSRNDFILIDLYDHFCQYRAPNLKNFRTSILKDKRINLDQKIEFIDKYYEIFDKFGTFPEKLPSHSQFYPRLTAFEIKHLNFNDSILQHISSFENMENLTKYQSKNFIWFVDHFLDDFQQPEWIERKLKGLLEKHSSLSTLINSLLVKIELKMTQTKNAHSDVPENDKINISEKTEKNIDKMTEQNPEKTDI